MKVCPLVLALLVLVSWAALVAASPHGDVTVFVAREEGDTATTLRKKALARGFAQAVTEAAVELSPCPLDEARKTLLPVLLDPRVNGYVLGYSEWGARHTPEGLELVLAVEVNRRRLRQDLASLGLAATCSQPLAVGLVPGTRLTAKDTTALRELFQLTGMVAAPGVQPELVVSRVSKDLLRGELHSGTGAWAANAPDMGGLWLALWPRYFAGQRSATAAAGREWLTVSGWFTPDGALEFDQELAGWDDEVASVRLLDLEMRSEGVAGRWELTIRDISGLKARLDAGLVGRGLTYRLETLPAAVPVSSAALPAADGATAPELP